MGYPNRVGTYSSRGDEEMKVYKTKNGQPYIKLANGRAKFIKKSRAGSVKRRTTRGVKVAKRKSYRRKSSSGFLGNLNKPIVGTLGVIAYESFLSPMIPVQGVAKDMLELVGGLYLSKKSGILGATGKTLVTLNTYQLAREVIGNKLMGIGQNNANYFGGGY